MIPIAMLTDCDIRAIKEKGRWAAIARLPVEIFTYNISWVHIFFCNV